MTKQTELATGILAGIGAGMAFGTDYLPAQILKDFSALEFYVGRAFFFGLASALFCRRALAAFMTFTVREKLHVACLNAAGFWLFSLLLFWSIQRGSAVVTTLVVGCLPATIALASTKLGTLGSAFMLGIALILAGLLVLHSSALFGVMDHSLAGWLLAFCCLVLWTWYAVSNTEFLRRHPGLSKTDMVSIMGVMSFAIMLAAGAALIDFSRIAHHEQLASYLLWA